MHNLFFFSGVIRQQLRRNSFLCYACSLTLILERIYMRESQRAKLYALCLLRRILARITAEYDDVQKTVTHQTVTSVDTAYNFTCGIEILNVSLRVRADLQAAVLIVKGRVQL